MTTKRTRAQAVVESRRVQEARKLDALDARVVHDMENGTINIRITGPLAIGKTTVAYLIRRVLEAAGAASVELLEDYKFGYNVDHMLFDKTLADRPHRKIVIDDRWDGKGP